MIFHKSKKDILNGNITEQILIFTVPLIGSYLLQQLYSIVDSIILGRYAGTIALAAVGASNSIVNIFLNLISGISAGVMVVLAQSYGSGSTERIKSTVKTAMFIAFAMGGILTIILYFFSNTTLEMTGCPQEAINDSLIYLRWYALSFIPYLIASIGNYVFRAMGDNRRSIILTLIICLSKIVLDIILTAILKMGIWGVSISTFAAQAICAIVVLIIFGLTPETYHYSILDFGCDIDSLKKIFKIGIPSAIQSMLFAVSNLVIQAKINSYGTDTIAAFTAFNSVDNYYWCFANAIGSATITLIGQNYGNKNMKRVKGIVKHALIVNLIGTMIISLTVMVFGRQLLAMYTTNANVIDIAYSMIKHISIFYSTYIFIEIISAALKGCSDSTNSMIITLIGVCVVRIVYVLFVQFSNAIQVLYCYAISWIITSLIFIVYYLSNKKYKLTDHN